MAVTRLTIVKFAELVLAIAILLIHYNTMEASGQFAILVTQGTFCGFVIIVVGIFIGFLTGNGLNKTIDLYFCLAGAILYIVAAIFTFQHFSGWKFNESHANLGLTKAGLALAQGVIFLIDSFFTFKAE